MIASCSKYLEKTHDYLVETEVAVEVHDLLLFDWDPSEGVVEDHVEEVEVVEPFVLASGFVSKSPVVLENLAQEGVVVALSLAVAAEVVAVEEVVVELELAVSLLFRILVFEICRLVELMVEQVS